MKSFLSIAAVCSLLLFETSQAQSVWIGTSNTSSNWGDPANWQGGNIPTSTDSITFQGKNRTTNFNDLGTHPVPLLTFAASAGPFTLQGEPIQFSDASAPNQIINNSASTQTIEFFDEGPFGGITNVGVPSLTIIAAAGDIVINSNIFVYNFNSTDSGAQELIFNGGNFTTFVNGVISNPINPADVVQLGGTTVLNNDNTFTGDVRIFGGELDAGSLNALGQRDTYLIGGTLATFNGPRPFTVGRDYIQTDGTLRMQIGGLDSGADSDFMTVMRDANLGGELFLHQVNNFMPTPGDRIPIIGTVTGNVIGEFASLADDFPGLIQPTLDYLPQEVDVVFDFSNTFVSAAKTPNQVAVGHALDHALAADCVVDLTNVLGSLPVFFLPTAYDQIAPEELAAIYDISFSQATVQTANLQNRMADIRAGSTGFCGAPPTAAAPSYAKDGKTVLSDKNSIMATVPENRWGVFATGTGQLASIGDNDFNAEGYDLTTGGFLTGIDYRILQNWAIGLSAGYAHSYADLSRDGHIDEDGAKVGLYSTFYTHGFYVDAAANGGWNSIDTTRAALFGDEHGSTDGADFSAFVGTGYDWKHNCWTIGPTATLQYTYAEFDSFTEDNNTLAPLHYPDQNQDSLRSTIGIHIAHEHVAKGDGITVRPEVRAAWMHEFNDAGYGIDANLVGCDDTFTVHGPRIGQDSGVVNGGVTVIFSRTVAAYLFYNGQFARNNYADSSVSGGLRFSW